MIAIHRAGSEPRRRRQVLSSFLAAYLLGPFRYRFAMLVSLTMLGSLASVAAPFVLGRALGTMADDPADAVGVFALFVVIWAIAALAECVQAQVDRFTTPALRHAVQCDAFARAIGRAPDFFDRLGGGAIGQRVKEMGRSTVLMTQILGSDFPQVLTAFVAAAAVLAATGRPVPAAIVFFWAVGFVGLSVLLAFRARPSIRFFSRSASESAGHLVDVLLNIDAVRAAWRQEDERRLVADVLDTERAANVESRGHLIGMTTAHAVGSLLLVAGMVWYATSQGLSISPDRIESVAAVLSLTMVLIGVTRTLTRTIFDFVEAAASLEEALSVLRDSAVERQPLSPQQPPLSSGPVTLDGVVFRYPDGAGTGVGPVHLAIPAGSATAVVGPSGAGKSTLLKLIRGIHAPLHGRVLLSEVDIAQLEPASLARSIGYLDQMPRLFDRSVRVNLTYLEPDADQEALADAIRAGGADRFLPTDDPGKLDAPAGTGGGRFSVGERQRILLARLLLGDRPVCLFDEPTSNLDVVSAAIVQATLRRLVGEGRTVVCVTHDLASVTWVDQIVYLEGGLVREVGTHTDLLAREGRYAALWASRPDAPFDSAATAADRDAREGSETPCPSPSA